jgi:hypothetical protein
MGFMSPRELNDDPRRWLDIPHEFHETLLSLQEKLFPGFKKKLEEQKVHCLECEGVAPFDVIVKDTLEPAICNGYIGDPDNIELMHLVDSEGDE